MGIEESFEIQDLCGLHREFQASLSYTENLGGGGWGQTKWLRMRICDTNTHVTEFSPQHC